MYQNVWLSVVTLSIVTFEHGEHSIAMLVYQFAMDQRTSARNAFSPQKPLLLQDV